MVTTRINQYCEKYNLTYEIKGTCYLCFYSDKLVPLSIQQELAEAFSEFSVFVMRSDKKGIPLDYSISLEDVEGIKALLDSCKTVEEFIANI